MKMCVLNVFVYLSQIKYPLLSLDEEEDQEDNEILQRAGNFISKQSDHLPKGIIDIGKVKDANCSKPFDVSAINYMNRLFI